MQHATGSEREGKTLEGTGNPILERKRRINLLQKTGEDL